MMKTTQFLTNIKFWQGIFVSFLLLVSLNSNSQNVGDDLLANSNGQVDTSSGATGSGGGCFSFGNNGNPGGTYDGVTQCGWTAAAGLNYAGANNSHGPTHSGDRMFKSYKTNGANGEFIAQEVGELALGTYSYSFFHRWTGGAVDYTDGAPKFTIKKANADGGWDNVLVVDLAVGETGASGAWTETAGSWENTEVNNYKIQVYKNGAANAGLAQNLHLDTFSFIYDAEPVVPDCEFSIVLSDSYGDGWNGNSLDVLVAGEVVLDDITIASGSEATYSFGGQNGDVVTVVYDDSGSYDGENSYEVFDNQGNSVVQNSGAGGGFSDPGPSGAEFQFDCASECEFTLVLDDSYGDGWNGNSIVLSINGEDLTEETIATGSTSSYVFGVNSGDVISLTYNDSGSYDGENSYSLLDNAGNVVASQAGAGGGFSDPGPASTTDLAVACSYDPVPAMEIQGVTDFNTGAAGFGGGNGGKAIHLLTTGDIEDMSIYTLNLYANGSTDVYRSITLPAESALAGEHILIYRELDAMTAYMGVSGFDKLYEGASLHATGSDFPTGNGNDAVELAIGDFTADLMGVIGDNPDTTGDGCDYTTDPDCWDHEDGWAYKVGGAFVYSEVNCTDGSLSSCDSSCPYPFIADACPFVPVLIDGGACLDFEGDSATDGWRFQDLGGVDSDWQLDTPALNGDNSLGHGYIPSSVAFQDIAVSPTFNTSAMTDAQLRYSEYMNWSSFGTANYVMYTLDDPATLDPATANVVILDTEVNAAAEDTWVERVFDLPEAEQVTLLFYYVGTNGHDWNIDDVCVEEVPPPPFHDVTFNVNTANINVGDFGMFLGDGIFGGSNAEQMSDDDGDGIYSVTLSLPEGTSGNYAFFNSPDADNAWSTKENLEGQECADSANYNSRFLDPIVADTVLSFCFASCEEACPDVTLYDVSFNVDTNNIEVGPNGMYVGGGFVGNAVAFAMSDDDMDGIYTKVLKYAEGTTGNYIFLNSPVHGGDWDAKEVLTGQDCADGQYDDRLLDPVTGDTTVQFCYGTCDTECVTEEPCEFSIVLTDLYGDGWNGNSLDVLVNGEVVLVDIATAIADGQDPVTFTFSVVTGDVIDVVYDPSGTWDGENAYVVYNNQGEEIAAESGAGGGSGDAGPANTIGLAAICAEPQNFVTADPNYEWGGYMVVFDVDGNYMFESGWDVADLQTTLNPEAPNIILEPNFNTYNAEDPYWSNGEIGNKIMLATTQVESDNLYNGVGLTFSGSVAEHTLGEDYEAVYFIKCLDQSAGWTDMLNAEYEIPLPESGEFSVSVSGDLLPEGKLVQFGFYVRGLNANPALDYGKVVIGDIGLSIGDNDSLDMVIYPNPVNGDYVTIQTPLNGDKLVEVFDVNGRKVMERLLTTDTLNVGSISAGMYIVKVTVEGQSNVSKLIVE